MERGARVLPRALALSVLLTVVPAHAGGVVEGHGPVPIGMLTTLWGPTEDMLGLRDGLEALGYRHNEHIALGARAAGGHAEELDRIVEQLLEQGAKILYASDRRSLEAAQRVTKETPIVFATRYSPVSREAGAERAENVTGVTPAYGEVAPDALDMFRALLPALQRVLVPYDADDPGSMDAMATLRRAASRLEIDLVERAVHSVEEARRAIMAARRPEIHGILPVGGRWNIAGYALEASLRHRMPALFSRAWMAEYGGLAAYGPSWYGLGREAAPLLARILEGARPHDLPIRMTSHAELVINLRAARTLDITVPPGMLAKADRVIE